MGKEKVVFAPYSRDQIIDIVRDRLSAVPGTVFEERAIQLAARKIASVSGDVRRALAVLRHAAELWEAAPEASRPAAVNVSLVSQAQKAMFSAVHMRVRPFLHLYFSLLLWTVTQARAPLWMRTACLLRGVCGAGCPRELWRSDRGPRLERNR